MGVTLTSEANFCKALYTNRRECLFPSGLGLFCLPLEKQINVTKALSEVLFCDRAEISEVG